VSPILLSGRLAIERATELALGLLDLTLERQDAFLDALRLSGHPTIVSRLDRLLLGINPRTSRADHLITIARFV